MNEYIKSLIDNPSKENLKKINHEINIIKSVLHQSYEMVHGMDRKFKSEQGKEKNKRTIVEYKALLEECRKIEIEISEILTPSNKKEEACDKKEEAWSKLEIIKVVIENKIKEILKILKK